MCNCQLVDPIFRGDAIGIDHGDDLAPRFGNADVAGFPRKFSTTEMMELNKRKFVPDQFGRSIRRTVNKDYLKALRSPLIEQRTQALFNGEAGIVGRDDDGDQDFIHMGSLQNEWPKQKPQA